MKNGSKSRREKGGRGKGEEFEEERSVLRQLTNTYALALFV
jgi:hypothetical protein